MRILIICCVAWLLTVVTFGLGMIEGKREMAPKALEASHDQVVLGGEVFKECQIADEDGEVRFMIKHGSPVYFFRVSKDHVMICTED